MLVYDRQPNGTYPAINDLLNGLPQSNTLNDPTGANLITANLNHNNFERFSILMDKMFCLPRFCAAEANVVEGPTGNGQYLPWFVDEYIKLKDLETSYKGTAAPEVIADINTGNLFLLMIGEYVAASMNWCYRGTARLRYRDN